MIYTKNILKLILVLNLLLIKSFFVLAQNKEGFIKNENMKTKSKEDSVPPLSAWILEDGYLKRPVEFDTLLPRFHIYNEIEKHNLSATFLGNIGSEYQSNIFFNDLNKPFTDFLPENQFADYFLTARKQKFYFTPKPYAELKYVLTNKKRNENDVHVVYTQNISPKFNYGIGYDLQSGDGLFPQSKVSEHSLNFFTGYTGDKYSIYAAVIRNKFRLQESGGIKPADIIDPDLTQARINGAYTQMYKSNFFVSQEYKFGYTKTKIVDDTLQKKVYQPIGKLNYVFIYDNNYRTHFDDDTLSDVYRDVLIGTHWTTDSINFRKWENALYWTFNNISFENAEVLNSVGAEYEIIRNYTFKGYVWKPDADYYHNISVKFRSEGVFKKFNYKFTGYYYLLGYKLNDFRATLNLLRTFKLKKHPANLSLTADVYQKEPALMEQFYYTNRFIWDNHFNKKGVAHLNVGFAIPGRSFKVELNIANLNNYVYFDSLAYPVQVDNGFNVYSVAIQKEFNFGLFSSMNKAVWQYADNQSVVSFPEFVFYHSLYFNYQYKKAAHIHLGYEVYYSTEFDALSFAPVTGQFYLGRAMKSGAYPLLNMYLDMGVKSVSIFFKFENISFQFFNKEFYYLAASYPMNPTLFKFGVSWRFHN